MDFYGIGIEKEYFENSFNIFKKLYPKDIYEDTGMGLAIVEKIIKKWGGDIWLKSTLYDGLQFLFYNPN